MNARPQPLVAIAGNPNAGKTTLFNRLTGSRGRVGNYPGVTVERHSGHIFLDAHGRVDLVDVPGAYSLAARSGEEQVAIEAVLGLSGNPRPDLVVLCVDATQLVRNLYLTLQIQELGQRVVVALTMVDEADRLGGTPDADALEEILGCVVVPVNAQTGEGLPDLKRAISEGLTADAAPIWRWSPSPSLAESIASARAHLPPGWPASDAMALWVLSSLEERAELRGITPELARAAQLEPAAGMAVDEEVARARYGWLDANVAALASDPTPDPWTARLDRVLIHPVWGFGVFLALMFVVFQSLFSWADPAIGLVEGIFGWLGEAASGALPASLLTDLLVEGVIGGVGSVVVFLPQILLLFFFVGLMEDSGYMARVAYLMDRVMRSMNLHGRAFVPMLSGFACAVPAVMATRTMERRRDRLLTMMVVPLMTCSARLPVYTLIIAALFPVGAAAGVFPIQGALMIGIYLFSTFTALAAAWVLSKTMKPLRGEGAPFLMELPPYRRPRLPDVLRMMWGRSRLFLSEAGSVILVCTVILWGLLTFPSVPAPDLTGLNDAQIEQVEMTHQGQQLRESYAGRLGQAIEPTISPLGFDWKMGVGLIGAFAAREVFVSTMGVVYNVGGDVDEESVSLRERIRAETRADGKPAYTPLVGLSLMVFFALACQCMSTLAVVKRESGGWRWPAFLFVYMTALAWIASFTVYQGGRLLGFS